MIIIIANVLLNINLSVRFRGRRDLQPKRIAGNV